MKEPVFLMNFLQVWKSMANKNQWYSALNVNVTFGLLLLLCVCLVATIFYMFQRRTAYKELLLKDIPWTSTVSISNLSKAHFSLNQCIEDFCIYFLHLNENTRNIEPIVACAVHSAATKNPEASVILLFKNPEIAIPEKLTKLNNVYSVEINETKILEGTPIIQWYKKVLSAAKAKSRYYMVEASNALRLALMYKYGGMYLDTDIITMQVTTIDL